LQAAPPIVSIVVPNYRTEDFTRLCLRSLRKYSLLPGEVIVVDNNSADGSTDYLRALSWIRLIENRSGSVGSLAHREALELAARAASGQWLVFLHSDTIVLREGWDRDLIAMAEADGAVGFSTTLRKIDRFEPWWRRQAAHLKDRLWLPREMSDGRVKAMSHCFAIRRDIVPWDGFSFLEAGDVVTDLYERFVLGRYRFLLLDRAVLEPLIWHTSNVTSVATGQMRGRKTAARFRLRTERLKRAAAIRAIIEDDSLDS
jgi:glycosyltransferase involved in cell wall biosynthesis